MAKKSNKNVYNIFRCPSCDTSLKYFEERYTKKLICDSCKTEYTIVYKNNIIKLLPTKFCSFLENINRVSTRKIKKIISYSEAKRAGDWLVEKLGIKEPEKVDWKYSVYLYHLAYVLKYSKKYGLDDSQTRIIVSLLGARNMSPKYKESVADLLRASREATSYEIYEELCLKEEIDKHVKEKGQDTLLIELGSGVGRLFIEYGSTITENLSEEGEWYRNLLKPIFNYDPEYNRHLKLILGVDFERKMLEEAYDWLKKGGLTYLVREGKLLQVQAIVHLLNIEFDRVPHKIVTILFQTLGNQLGEDLQIKMLEKAREIASPNGTIFVSVFNRDIFAEQATKYYDSIKKSVGRRVYCKNGIFLSNKGVFSIWFDKNYLRRLFKKARIKNVRILNGDSLPRFDLSWFPKQKQEKYRKRAIIAVAKV